MGKNRIPSTIWIKSSKLERDWRHMELHSEQRKGDTPMKWDGVEVEIIDDALWFKNYARTVKAATLTDEDFSFAVLMLLSNLQPIHVFVWQETERRGMSWLKDTIENNHTNLRMAMMIAAIGTSVLWALGLLVFKVCNA
jgi:hypothetical protein